MRRRWKSLLPPLLSLWLAAGAAPGARGAAPPLGETTVLLYLIGDEGSPAGPGSEPIEAEPDATPTTGRPAGLDEAALESPAGVGGASEAELPGSGPTPGGSEAPGGGSLTAEAVIGEMLRRIAQVRYPAGVRFLAMYDRGKAPRGTRVAGTERGGAYRLALEPGPGSRSTWKVASELGKVDGGDPGTLGAFLRWGASRAPARRYSLLVVGHGSGILGGLVPGPDDPDGPDDAEEALGEPGPGGPSPRSRRRFQATSDRGSGSSLSFPQLRRTLEEFRRGEGGQRPLELLAFVSCLAGSLEMLHELRAEAQVVVASGAGVSFGASDGQPLFRSLAQDAGASAAQLGLDVVAAMATSSLAARARMRSAGGPSEEVGGDVLAAWDMARVPELVRACDQLAARLLDLHRDLGLTGLAGLTRDLEPPFRYDIQAGYADLLLLVESLADPGAFRLPPMLPDQAGTRAAAWVETLDDLVPYALETRFAAETSWDELQAARLQPVLVPDSGLGVPGGRPQELGILGI